MEFQKFSSAIFLLAFVLLLQASASAAAKKSYIVYMGVHPHGSNPTELDSERATDLHHHFLASFLGSEEKAKDAIFYSYNKHINGFSAMLEEEEAAQIAKHAKVVSVFLDKPMKLHTTHSWEFLTLTRNDVALPHSLTTKARFGEDSIIANLDSGVWPESASFDDTGYGPVPQRYKGPCDNGGYNFNCNRKLIGARFYSEGCTFAMCTNATELSPRDIEGHGSHTLSTAAGNPVVGANVLGVGNGTAMGGSSRARVATYKVCWKDAGCVASDVLAGFDDAIQDGVDVISVSLGGDAGGDYTTDAVAIGAFHAVRKGVHVVCSAGNDGPHPGSVSNVAPWIFTIGASTIDREFQSFVLLGNGLRFKGTSVSSSFQNGTYYPLISGDKAKLDNASATDALLCKPGTLDPSKAGGKIVACLRGENARVDKGVQAYLARAAGLILCNTETNGNELISDPHIIPASHINYVDGVQVLAYINSTENPKAMLTPAKAVTHTKPAPAMAAFSSRGPNIINPEILKPDITAPGVNIIAAYTEALSPSEEDEDSRRIPFITMSGTSMSCPHVSGVVGLLKTLYPHWSPAAVRSALMTSARTRDNTMNPMTDQSNNNKSNPFAYGSGHIRPNRAMNPGLIYDLEQTDHDYLQFLCAIDDGDFLGLFLEPGQDYECKKENNTLRHFNYPSFSVPHLRPGRSYTMKRRVTNVGTPGTYKVSVRQPAGATISVLPDSLTFEKVGEVKVFKVKVDGKWSTGGYAFGGITWSDGNHYVRSPVAVNVA